MSNNFFGPMSPEDFIRFISGGGGSSRKEDAFEDEGEIICLLKDYPTIKEIKAEADRFNEMIKARQRINRERYEREAKACMAELQKMKMDFWAKIEAYLEHIGVMPEKYRKQIDNLAIENGALVMFKSKDNVKRDHDGNQI